MSVYIYICIASRARQIRVRAFSQVLARSAIVNWQFFRAVHCDAGCWKKTNGTTYIKLRWISLSIIMDEFVVQKLKEFGVPELITTFESISLSHNLRNLFNVLYTFENPRFCLNIDRLIEGYLSC